MGRNPFTFQTRVNFPKKKGLGARGLGPLGPTGGKIPPGILGQGPKFGVKAFGGPRVKPGASGFFPPKNFRGSLGGAQQFPGGPHPRGHSNWRFGNGGWHNNWVRGPRSQGRQPPKVGWNFGPRAPTTKTELGSARGLAGTIGGPFPTTIFPLFRGGLSRGAQLSAPTQKEIPRPRATPRNPGPFR